MGFFFTALILFVLLTADIHAEEKKAPPDSSIETKLPASSVPSQAITLAEAIKQVSQDGKNKILAAKTELIEGKKVHVIKILTATGHIQHIKIDASTGKTLEEKEQN